MATEALTKAEAQPLRNAALIGALGIVFGDIGTSPLYAYKEALASAGDVDALRPIAFGCVSLVFWALIIVVSIKYVLVIMRATNDGEGGVMALTALALNALKSERSREIAVLVGLVGVALFYGDCIITPAISVLSAVEGLEVATPVFKPFIVPIAAGILAALFMVQYRGTASIGRIFGPVMVVWFAVLALAGIPHIVARPDILAAVNPIYGLDLIATHGWIGFHVLGSVFLALTGAEALYADEGHFEGKVIRIDWFSFVLPALMLNYFGQGALVLENPDARTNPFFYLFADWLLYPAVALATAATIIASQAVITGAFTITQQAVSLGFMPRMEIRFTSKTEASQIYIPQANWLMAAAVLGLVLYFESSSALAGAYGLAVATTMVVSTLLVGVVARNIWGWSLLKTGLIISLFLIVDLAFFGANLIKFFEGGFLPVLVGAGIFTAMVTWRRGRVVLNQRIARENPPFQAFWEEVRGADLCRVPGIAVYLTSRPDRIPPSLHLNVKHNKCLHDTVVLLTVITERIPRVPKERRAYAEQLQHGFIRVILRFGFAESPNVPRALRRVAAERRAELFFDPAADVSYFVGRAIPVPSTSPEMSEVREQIFIILTKNATTATNFFCIPAEDVVELGTFIEI
ncbi:potassium transporter [Rhodomicrobium vannielii ATCC 17100]|uniref:Probable potassium transport system protein Kup n=1 Tax=Rhodomicrobium vannielii (strain ATCC 17100 / DSM 162 / LMG 4299 / NCIMB 10020 / ATH 3.1.1) TaxID=648757 RepID=E3I0J1_RHOVT|nr:KUP/HAK/KT family potassium transporter [Rhodomicrobium vannielii]ADP70001.1 potassium transporter [Rhodomicrobium vannielii ATCC 17100]